MNSKRILLVDDSRAARSVGAHQLKSLGYDVDLAVDPLEAIQLIAGGTPYHAILTDLTMPRMSGISFIQIVKSRVTAATPIFVVSADVSPEMTRLLLKLGVAGILDKPFQATTFQTLLEQSHSSQR